MFGEKQVLMFTSYYDSYKIKFSIGFHLDYIMCNAYLFSLSVVDFNSQPGSKANFTGGVRFLFFLDP